MAKIKTVIKRSEWLRGEGPTLSFLYRGDGKRCCLGFRMNVAGFTDNDLLSQGSPADLSYGVAEPDQIPSWLLSLDNETVGGYTTDLCDMAMKVNDCKSDDYDNVVAEMSGEENVETPEAFEAAREAIIKSIFEKAGEEVEFVD
jgi:hypothetical protein